MLNSGPDGQLSLDEKAAGEDGGLRRRMVVRRKEVGEARPEVDDRGLVVEWYMIWPRRGHARPRSGPASSACTSFREWRAADGGPRQPERLVQRHPAPASLPSSLTASSAAASAVPVRRRAPPPSPASGPEYWRVGGPGTGSPGNHCQTGRQHDDRPPLPPPPDSVPLEPHRLASSAPPPRGPDHGPSPARPTGPGPARTARRAPW